jgi:hypothetical protein
METQDISLILPQVKAFWFCFLNSINLQFRLLFRQPTHPVVAISYRGG